MLIPVLLGFAGSYAAALVTAIALHVDNPWAVTLGVGSALFLIVIVLARRNRQDR